MPKFLIIRFSSIGDIIQCMGIISGIRAHFPDAQIHWITRKDMATILTIDSRIDKIWAFDKTTGLKGLLQMAEQLRQEHYDYIYDAHSNIRSYILRFKLLRWWGRTHFTRRSKERWKRFLLFKFGINRFPWPFRGTVSYQRPLSKWGITNFPDTDQHWRFPEDFPEKLDHYLSPQTVTIIPSANWPMKRWPVESWRELISDLHNYNFLILAGPEDTFCKFIQHAAPKRVTNLAGKTSLLESCYLVSRSKVVVSADTGLMHAADLFRVPTFALIGPTAFGFPSGPTAEICEVALPCRPCTKDGRGKCKRVIYQQCMIYILPEDIAEKIQRLLPQS